MDSVLNSSILIVQKLALHQNGVEFRQQFNGAIKTSLTAYCDDVRRRATLLRNLLEKFVTHTHSRILELSLFGYLSSREEPVSLSCP